MRPWKIAAKLCWYVLVLFLSCVSPIPPERYVRAGAVGGDGSDWTNAYSALPATLVRGVTYYIADGFYGNYHFDDPVSGASLITLRKATRADHGTDVGWDPSFGDGQAIFGTGIVFSTGFYVLDGQVRSGKKTGHGFKIDNSAGSRTELVRFSSGGGSQVTNITLRYLVVVGRGIGQTSVIDRVFYSIVPGNSFTIQYSYVTDAYVPFLTRQANGITVEYTYFGPNNSDATNHAETWSDAGSDNVTFRYNDVEDPEGTAVIFCGNGRGSSPTAANTSASWDIYGNTIWHTIGYVREGISQLIHIANNSSNRNWAHDWKIYNNTFHNLKGLSSRVLNEATDISVRKPVLRNNLWNNSKLAYHINTDSDYNWYRNTTHTAEPNGQIGISDPFVNSGAGDFHLAGPTKSGAELGLPYDRDPDGMRRGVDGVWDKGAYEFGGSPVRPSSSRQDVMVY